LCLLRGREGQRARTSIGDERAARGRVRFVNWRAAWAGTNEERLAGFEAKGVWVAL